MATTSTKNYQRESLPPSKGEKRQKEKKYTPEKIETRRERNYKIKWSAWRKRSRTRATPRGALAINRGDLDISINSPSRHAMPPPTGSQIFIPRTYTGRHNIYLVRVLYYDNPLSSGVSGFPIGAADAASGLLAINSVDLSIYHVLLITSLMAVVLYHSQ